MEAKMLNKEEFKKIIEKYISEENISATALGIKTLKDPSFVLKVSRGREVRECGKLKVINFICENSPDFAIKHNLIESEA
jgi:hypothetical protein